MLCLGAQAPTKPIIPLSSIPLTERLWLAKGHLLTSSLKCPNVGEFLAHNLCAMLGDDILCQLGLPLANLFVRRLASHMISTQKRGLVQQIAKSSMTFFWKLIFSVNIDCLISVSKQARIRNFQPFRPHCASKQGDEEREPKPVAVTRPPPTLPLFPGLQTESSQS